MPTYRGKWHGAPFRDFKTKKYYITVELDMAPGIYETTTEKEIAVTVEPWEEKRSNAANRYYYELVGKIAAKLYASKTEIHNWIIAEYGQPDEEADDIIMKAEIDWRRVEALHLRPYQGQQLVGDDGQIYQVYQIMRGSHTYKTSEMAQLIEGVIKEAKEIGIETLPPAEIERIREQWQKK